jgi:hypothetical protein
MQDLAFILVHLELSFSLTMFFFWDVGSSVPNVIFVFLTFDQKKCILCFDFGQGYHHICASITM